eukprot:CAMPEP_0172690474 /NCGR_PEP_ID=MMETSP1074-20121228/23884_1 /TAXON_ID=2916 /ORGANISM="Ceratium fusus, Strain PA161109" /LENGTH=51 /DNA_ID=CAMNT_0013510417 /DNA_START=66 /DNA_END=221 /DNA_ORIENTATION=+
MPSTCKDTTACAIIGCCYTKDVLNLFSDFPEGFSAAPTMTFSSANDAVKVS